MTPSIMMTIRNVMMIINIFPVFCDYFSVTDSTYHNFWKPCAKSHLLRVIPSSIITISNVQMIRNIKMIMHVLQVQGGS